MASKLRDSNRPRIRFDQVSRILIDTGLLGTYCITGLYEQTCRPHLQKMIGRANTLWSIARVLSLVPYIVSYFHLFGCLSVRRACVILTANYDARSVRWQWYRLPLHRQWSYQKYRILHSCSPPRSLISYWYELSLQYLSWSHARTKLPGVFKRILPLATSHSLRVICLSRREYEGSTPYSTDELNVIHHGSEAELADFMQAQGVLVALFVDRLIQTLLLPKKGGVIVAGWSLGNVFTIAMRASIDNLPDDTQQRLKAYTRGFIIYGLSLHPLSQPRYLTTLCVM